MGLAAATNGPRPAPARLRRRAAPCRSRGRRKCRGCQPARGPGQTPPRSRRKAPSKGVAKRVAKAPVRKASIARPRDAGSRPDQATLDPAVAEANGPLRDADMKPIEQARREQHGHDRHAGEKPGLLELDAPAQGRPRPFQHDQDRRNDRESSSRCRGPWPTKPTRTARRLRTVGRPPLPRGGSDPRISATGPAARKASG